MMKFIFVVSVFLLNFYCVFANFKSFWTMNIWKEITAIVDIYLNNLNKNALHIFGLITYLFVNFLSFYLFNCFFTLTVSLIRFILFILLFIFLNLYIYTCSCLIKYNHWFNKSSIFHFKSFLISSSSPRLSNVEFCITSMFEAIYKTWKINL